MPGPTEAPPADRPIVIVSNRGPVAFTLTDDGDLVARRGAGGLVSGLGPLVAGTDTVWLAAAMTDADREAARRQVNAAEGFNLVTVVPDADDFRMAYDVVGNATLWFVHHHLFDHVHRPRFGTAWRQAWAAYRRVNEAFADAVVAAAPADAAVLVQDYHLALLAEPVRRMRPDLRLTHFSHTPFAGPDELRVLPDAEATELVSGLAAHDACGFHTRRWADRFVASCAHLGLDPPEVFVSPLPVAGDDISAVAAAPRTEAELAGLQAQVGERRVIVRVDRIELSKNLLRGFHAFDDLLARYPQWRQQVVFAALCYPSREGLAEYLAYRQEVEGLVDQINARWSTPDWTPIILDQTDNFPRSVAALRLYDVLLVNPISDGLNLVAKEGALVNEHDGVIVLSEEAGVVSELGPSALRINPYDVAGTADTLHSALSMAVPERRRLASDLRTRATRRRPEDWLADQRRAAR